MPGVTLAEEIQWAKEHLAVMRRQLADVEREARLYDSELDYTPSLRYALLQARETVTKAERKLKRLEKRKSNPMAKKKAKRKTKRTLSAKQLRALAKGRAVMKKRAAAKKRTAKKATKKTRRKNPAYGNFLSASRAAIRHGVNPVRASKRATPHYAIKSKGGFFDGAGFTRNARDAAHYRDLKTCKRIAQRVADASGRDCSIVDMAK